MTRALLLLPALASCAITADVLHALAGPHARPHSPGPQIATERVERWREVSFDKDGLACFDVEAPWMRTSEIATHVVNPDGYKAATQFFTVAEALLLGIVVASNEYLCARDGCDSRRGYRWLVPIGIDVAWGTYRSFRIHDEILRSTTVTWNGPTPPIADLVTRDACPVGTEVVLEDAGQRFDARIDVGGHVAIGALAGLVAFISAHRAFAIPEAHVRLDASGVASMVTAFRAQVAAAAPRAPVPPATTPPPPPPSAPTGVTIDVNVDVRVPHR